MGRPLTEPSILLRGTLAGDGNLDGIVNFDDLLTLAQHYGKAAGARWTEGDSNRDGKVDFDDLLALAQRYGSSISVGDRASPGTAVPAGIFADWQLARSLVPEPSLGIGLLASSCLRRRR
jgi:hypothetical protein